MGPDHIEQFFAYEHLPPALQEVSKPFCELKEQLVALVPRNPERTVALRKLLEAKDAAVRAMVAKEPAEGPPIAASHVGAGAPGLQSDHADVPGGCK